MRPPCSSPPRKSGSRPANLLALPLPRGGHRLRHRRSARRSPRQRALFLEQYPELAGKRLILFLGRIHEKKGCDLLLRAWQEVSHHRRKTAADLIWSWPDPADNAYGAEMKELARRTWPGAKVTWTGMLTGDLKWGASAPPSLHPPLAPGKFRHLRGRGAGLRRPGPHFEQGQHLARDRRRRRRSGRKRRPGRHLACSSAGFELAPAQQAEMRAKPGKLLCKPFRHGRRRRGTWLHY